MSKYSYSERCPVCSRDIKRRPAELAGRPCANCGERYITPRDRYRLRNARLTPTAITAIIDTARTAWQAQQDPTSRATNTRSSQRSCD